jgi:hypothetical protein
MALNVEEFIQGLINNEKEAADIKKEVETFQKKRLEVERDVPHGIDIGLFHVDCSQVKEALLDKCVALATEALELLGRQCRNQADKVCVLYWH